MPLFGKKPHQRVLATETIVIQLRFHWAAMRWVAPQTVLGVFLLFGLHLLTVNDFPLINIVAWYGAMVLIIRLAYHIAHWWDTLLIITDVRFMLCSGLISSRAAMMPVSRVTDLEFKQTATGGVLGYGRVRIESAGQHQDLELLNFLPHFDEVEEAISKLIFGKGSEHKAKTSVRKLTTRERRRARRKSHTMDEVSQTFTDEGDGT